MNNKSLPDRLREMISETIRKAGLGVLAGPRGFGALNTLHYIGKGFICAKIFRRGHSGTGVSPCVAASVGLLPARNGRAKRPCHYSLVPAPPACGQRAPTFTTINVSARFN